MRKLKTIIIKVKK